MSACENFCTHSSEDAGIFVQLPAEMCVQTADVKKKPAPLCTCASVEKGVAKKY